MLLTYTVRVSTFTFDAVAYMKVSSVCTPVHVGVSTFTFAAVAYMKVSSVHILVLAKDLENIQR